MEKTLALCIEENLKNNNNNHSEHSLHINKVPQEILLYLNVGEPNTIQILTWGREIANVTCSQSLT